jgi:hypothetical protein
MPFKIFIKGVNLKQMTFSPFALRGDCFFSSCELFRIRLFLMIILIIWTFTIDCRESFPLFPFLHLIK